MFKIFSEHGLEGNGYVFEPFDPAVLQNVLEDLSARFYAYIYTREGKTAREISQYPNKRWVELVKGYMKEKTSRVKSR